MKIPSIFCAVFLIGLLANGSAAGQEQMVPGQIRAVKVEGTAWQTSEASNQRERIKVGDILRQGNRIETAADGRVLLLFDNGSAMDLRPNTSFSISEFVRDPFDARKIDYKNIKGEPSRSVTQVNVKDGTIYFDIPKLKKTSVCNIGNPVGTAGIRGTAGFVAQNSMGVTEGLVQVQTQTGQTQSLGAGQATGFTPQGNFGPPPNNANQNMQGAQNNSQSLPQNIPSDAFAGAPQASSQGNLTQQQQQAIEEAAQQGQEALVQAVEQIASESPQAAAAAAAAAATLLPQAAPQIASAAAAAVPQSQAASLAPTIASAVAAVATTAAPQIAAAVAGVVGNAAPQIAAAVAGTVPSQAPAIAQSVAQVAPSQASNIATAVTSAAPSADAAAVSQAAQQGSQQGNQAGNQGGGSGSGSGGGAPPAMPGGFGGGGGGGGGTTGGGGQYSTQ